MILGGPSPLVNCFATHSKVYIFKVFFFQKCISAKCIQLACLLSFASLFNPTPIERIGSLELLTLLHPNIKCEVESLIFSTKPSNQPSVHNTQSVIISLLQLFFSHYIVLIFFKRLRISAKSLVLKPKKLTNSESCGASDLESGL